MDQAEVGYGQGAPSRLQRKGNRPDPIGYPFSYVAQFQDSGGLELIRHPFQPWFQRFVRHPLFVAFHWPKRLAHRSRRLLAFIRRRYL
jgi:hypothetical protein